MSSDTAVAENPELDSVGSEPEFDRDSVKNTIKVAVQVCLACSVVVSVCAVVLRPMQERNRKLFEQKNILQVSGLYNDGDDIGETFEENVVSKIVDLREGAFTDEFDVATFDPLEWERKGPAPEDDIARIKRLEAYGKVYEVEVDAAEAEDGGGGRKKQVLVLPIRGYGLWSILYGFIALDVTDIQGGLNTVKVVGLTYYKDGETPGLGGEVNNPTWKAKWKDRVVFDEGGKVLLKVAKAAKGDSQVDALSGATITSNGVTNMLQFWLGQQGYGPLLKSMATK